MPQGIEVLLSSDAAHAVIRWGIRFFCALTLLQIIVLIIQKIVLERLIARRSKLKEQYVHMLKAAASSPTALVNSPSKRVEYEAFADAVVDVQTSLTPRQGEAVRQVIRQLDIPLFFVSTYSSSRSWVKKYRAVEWLGFMKLPELRDFYRKALDAKGENSYVTAKLIWSLSLIAQEEDVPLLAQRLATPGFMSAKFCEYVFCNIINAFKDRSDITTLIYSLEHLFSAEEVPLLLKRDIVQACGITSLKEAEGLIMTMLKTYGKAPEMRIAGIRALQGAGGRLLDQVVAAGLRDKDWRVRVAAAKDTSKCSSAVIALLAEVLGDENYHVRLNAAASLAAAGSDGIAILREKSLSSDRFIRDISKYMLAA